MTCGDDVVALCNLHVEAGGHCGVGCGPSRADGRWCSFGRSDGERLFDSGRAMWALSGDGFGRGPHGEISEDSWQDEGAIIEYALIR